MPALKTRRYTLLVMIAGAIAGVFFALGHGRHPGPVPPLLQFSWPMVIAVVLICVFSIYWDTAAKGDAPAQASESAASRRFHLITLNVGVLILVLPLPGLTHRFLPRSHILIVPGLAIELGGILFAIWARHHLGRNWSGEVRIATGHELIRSGPYRNIRHPIYTGVLGMYLGAMIVSGEWHALLGMTIITLAYLRKLRLEERILSATFGPPWDDWRRHSWALLPPLF